MSAIGAVELAGARAAPPIPREGLLAHVQAVAAEHDVVLQVVDADAVYGPEHLLQAVRLAWRAHQRGDGIASDRGAEIALYASGERQIQRALAVVGVPDPVERVALVAVGAAAAAALGTLLARAGLRRDDTLLAPKPEALARLGIRPTPGADPIDLVLERAALVDALK